MPRLPIYFPYLPATNMKTIKLILAFPFLVLVYVVLTIVDWHIAIQGRDQRRAETEAANARVD
jgi:hypothetical protein